MKVHFQRFLFLCAAMLLMAACGSSSPVDRTADDVMKGRILLWHTWTGEEGRTLDALLASYRQLRPGVDIISVGVDESRLVDRLVDDASGGLGPDLVLADTGAIYDLAEQGVIRNLAPLNLDLSAYLSTAAAMVSDAKNLYALPFAGHTEVLFYNKNLIKTPPETIAELSRRVADGEVFAQSTDFVNSYWGVGAHDGGMVDSERRLSLGLGGFENWLDFLANLRTLPGFLPTADRDALRKAVTDGKVAYFVADSTELTKLMAAFGEENVGVALLPSGPNGSPARPFLRLDAFAFSNASSDHEFALALGLAQFLAGAQSQAFLATNDMGRVPVNDQVRLAPSLPANTLTVARQTRNAEPVLFTDQRLWRDLRSGALGFFKNYEQAVQGILDPHDVVEQSIRGFSDGYSMESRTVPPSDLCPAEPGAITVWHALRSAEARVFEQLAAEFMVICSETSIEIRYFPYEEIAQRFAEEARAGGGPDMLFESSRWLAPLAEEGLLVDLTERVPPSSLQQFIPNTVETMRYNGRLYGIPESVDTMALFINTAMQIDPPIDLQDLVQDVSPDRRAALPVGFFSSYWGLEPFGGFSFDSYSGKILDTTGLVAWLETLQGVQRTPGMDLYFNATLAEDAFAYEEAGYLVSGPSSLPRLQEELGADRFQVLPLPNGPAGPGSPILRVNGTMINANASRLAVDLALAFGQFLDLPENQQRFLKTGDRVTASVTVDLHGYPNIEGFHRQAKVAALAVENSNFAVMQELGDQLYRSVLEDGADPAQAVPAFVEAVHAATGAK